MIKKENFKNVLEKEWQLGHTGKSRKADIFITDLKEYL